MAKHEAKAKSPHTNSQQNANVGQTGLNPDDGASVAHKTEPQAVAHEGSVTSRISHDASRQGISNRSAASEAGGQEKVVSQREDAQAGVNHSGKAPRQ